MPSVIVGMDTIPVEIHTTDPDTGALFKRFLPGWEGAGEYNFRAGTSSQRAAAQLEVLMQSGPHPYINNQIKVLLNQVIDLTDGNYGASLLNALISL